MLRSKIDEDEKLCSTLDEDVTFVIMSSGNSFIHYMKLEVDAESNGNPNHTSLELESDRTPNLENMEILSPCQTEEEACIVESTQPITDYSSFIK